MTNSKVVLITGAAKRIGACIATTFHSKGYRVLIHANKSIEEGTKITEELNQAREKSAAFLQADFNELKKIERFSENALDYFGRIDALVNNASMFYPTPIKHLKQSDWDKLFNSNVRAAFFLCQALEDELSSRSGSIINIVDAHVGKTLRDHSIYSMAKSALNSMTKSLALELGNSIKVNGVSPGAILWPPNLEEDNSEATEKIKKELLAKIPLQRLGKPEDIANMVYFLAESGNYISGQVIKVDGGRSLV